MADWKPAAEEPFDADGPPTAPWAGRSKTIEFRMLGPLEVRIGDSPVVVAGLKRRATLALLLLHVNRPLSLTYLIERVWEQDRPRTAEAALRNSVSALRKTLRDVPGVTLGTVGQGYILRADDDTLDTQLFHRLRDEGRRKLDGGDPAGASRLLVAALDLWRGPALADLVEAGVDWPEAVRLEESRLRTIEDRIEADLHLGRHRELVAELEKLTRAYPGRATLYRQHMVALFRSGRQAHALAAYQSARKTILELTSREPDDELQDVLQAILEQRADLLADRDDSPGQAPPSRDPDPDRPVELRMVTVLCVDADRVADGVGGAGRGHPVESALPVVLEQVRVFGGQVEQVLGSTVMALFGVPSTHDNDPERAVRAALAIRDLLSAPAPPPAARPTPAARVTSAIVSGAVLVRPASPPSAAGPTIVGSVLDDCVRLLESCPRGAVLVSQETFRATRHAVHYRPATRSGTAGRAAVAVRTDHHRSVGMELGAFVNRAHELALLDSVFTEVARHRTPHLVTLLGAPGIGKSRLVQEMIGRTTARGDRLVARRGHTPWFPASSPLAALEEIVAAHAGVLATDEPEAVRGKLDHAVRLAFGPNVAAPWVLAHLYRLIGSSQEAGFARPDEAPAAWQRFLEAVAAQTPLVLVFEDLQWAEDALLDFVEDLADRCRPVPMLVIVTARPELLDRRPSWGGGRRNTHALTLQPLSPADTARLMAALLSRPERPHGLAVPGIAPSSIRDELLQRVGGNPFFAVEYARMLDDRAWLPGDLVDTSRDTPTSIPETVHGVIAARLDILDPRDKAVLRNAAVIGTVFWIDALAETSERSRTEIGECLDRLERRELVLRSGSSAVAGDVEYTFSHVLVREVAYEQIPRTIRARAHCLVAAWIERALPAERADLLAYHWQEAMRYLDAAERPIQDLLPRALAALGRAGRRARALGATSAADRCVAAAAAIVQRAPDR